MGFFDSSAATERRIPLGTIPKCGACGLFKKCRSPKMPYSGKGKKGILIVGDFPRQEEDERNKHFAGKDGQLLSRTLAKYGADLRDDCWLTNALICRPPRDRIHDDDAVDFCRPNILKTLKDLRPTTIILLGSAAIKSVINYAWGARGENTSDTRWAGWQIPSQKLNAWICPTFHPTFVIDEEDPIITNLFEGHIEEALDKVGRPWETVPDYKSQVEIYQEPNDPVIAKRIRRMIAFGKPVAFDYETNMLKPDSKAARIVSFAASNGDATIAFPWHGRAKDAAAELIRSRIPKIASNLKFEDRWTRAKLHTEVCNWQFDTMIGAHILDHRPEITGLKFQSFVQLGQEAYANHIEQYLKAEGGGNSPNQIHKIKLEDLLIYNGLDALLEVLVAKKQRKLFKE